ncbi:hypothetical protein CAOG_010133 [Capsaspora owczarzaki ATCC 30864]|uniref:Uncharacterized protein n=1 Tax=Capsaspora owczarzaki (strain ATCC 30864) TaxID=595528 RepID=A0A0D2X5B1_CAPO3|nr:hypothetical protein CAOG_010133 [Capsaspora owczarzaki ATCC 30864]
MSLQRQRGDSSESSRAMHQRLNRMSRGTRRCICSMGRRLMTSNRRVSRSLLQWRSIGMALTCAAALRTRAGLVAQSVRFDMETLKAGRHGPQRKGKPADQESKANATHLQDRTKTDFRSPF